MNACIDAAQKLVLDQEAHRRKGNKHVQGKVMGQTDTDETPGTHGT